MDWSALLLNDRVVASLVTALVGGFVVAAGWFWTHALSRRRDKFLRWEQIGDMQRALLAEIRAHVVALEAQQDNAGPMTLSMISDEDYLPILPHEANDRIFRALAEDIRSNASKHPKRAALMLRDYLEINEETRDTGIEALEILTASLQGGPDPENSRIQVEKLLKDQKNAANQQLLANLPSELGQLKAGVSKQASDRSVL